MVPNNVISKIISPLGTTILSFEYFKKTNTIKGENEIKKEF